MKFAILSLCLAFSACSTVTPQLVTPDSASFDGNDQTSGIISVNANGYVVTDHFRDRYNALVAIYGSDFSVSIKADDGLINISTNRWLIDRQHLSQFLEMTAWLRAGLKPKSQ